MLTPEQADSINGEELKMWPYDREVYQLPWDVDSTKQRD